MKFSIKHPLYSFVLFMILVSCQQKPADTEAVQGIYTEQHRPQFHFSPAGHWMNDPNGMVYHDGEYHLFYQYYPDSTVWGPMHWGHAVTKDLIHWDHLPIALYPDSLGLIFSGSAVVDHPNTTGLGSEGNPPLVAIFTYHLVEGEKAGRTDYQNQGMAYSLDKGRTWTKYVQNPVLRNQGIKDFRDPKVFWYEQQRKWVMILAVQDHVEFYSSPDLKSWVKLSEFGKDQGGHGGVWECPDLFPLKINGEEKWVMLLSINPGSPNGGSGTQYFVGQFDGTTFKNDYPEKTLWLDQGRDNYAGVTWSNIPPEDGRRLFLGWMSNWDYAQVVPTQVWRSAMTLPRELFLANTPEGIRLASKLVKETDQLAGEEEVIGENTIAGELEVSSAKTESGLFALEMELDSTSGKDFTIELSNEVGEKFAINYSVQQNSFFIDRSASGNLNFSENFGKIQQGLRAVKSYPTNVQVIVDHSSVEVFADGGTLSMTATMFPSEVFRNLKIRSESLKISSITIKQMKRIW